MKRILAAVTCILLAGAAVAHAQMEPSDNRLFTYRGRLERGGGPVHSAHDLRFGLFATENESAACLTGTLTTCGLWAQEVTGVLVANGDFVTTLGGAAARPLSDAVLARNALYLAIAVRAVGETDYVLLGAKQRIVPSLMAARAAAAKDFKVTGALTVGGDATLSGNTTVSGNTTLSGDARVSGATTLVGDTTVGRVTPAYAAYSASHLGEGGSAIVNDNTGYKALMIIGNTSDGTATRKISMWDNVKVWGNLEVRSGHTLTLNSQVVRGLQVSSEYVATADANTNGCSDYSATANADMTAETTSICFLTGRSHVDAMETFSPSGVSDNCTIAPTGGVWRLTATASSSHGCAASRVTCRARCLSWDW
jgi:hypothetical protein